MPARQCGRAETLCRAASDVDNLAAEEQLAVPFVEDRRDRVFVAAVRLAHPAADGDCLRHSEMDTPLLDLPARGAALCRSSGLHSIIRRIFTRPDSGRSSASLQPRSPSKYVVRFREQPRRISNAYRDWSSVDDGWFGTGRRTCPGPTTDNRNYQPGVLCLNIAPIGSFRKTQGLQPDSRTWSAKLATAIATPQFCIIKNAVPGRSQSVRISGIELALPNLHKPTTTIARPVA
jgi:hypothetical protein